MPTIITRNLKVLFAMVLLTLGILTVQSSEVTPLADDKVKANVIKVIDGDTVDVSINNKIERIRVIGINTPEIVDPRKSVECFGEEASAAAKNYLTGQTVWLEADTSQDNRDKYGRLLRYIWMDNGTEDYGRRMIATGYAHEYTYEVPYKYQQLYKQTQKEAEQNKKGLWSDNACMATMNACKYSCNSPDRDCADFSNQIEAQTFFTCCGFTAENDPMRLDGAGVIDGIVCESLP